MVTGGYEEFTRLMRLLGLRMKESKALPPSHTQKVLGVNMSVDEEGVHLSPHPHRCHKLLSTMQTALAEDKLSQEEAHRLAGKMVFLTSTMFGQLGRAALQPLYSRAHGLSDIAHRDQLNPPLRAALRTLMTLLKEVQPRVIPRSCTVPIIVIYTDAYFVQDGQRFSP